MVLNVRVMLLSVVFLLLPATMKASAEERYLTSGMARSRALAMGGAFHSVEDDFSAGFYNPGAFRIYSVKSERRLKVFFNPAATASALYDYSKYDYDYDRDDELTVGEALYSLAFFLKGMTYTTTVLDMGFGLGEEVIDFTSQKTMPEHVFSFEGMSRCQFHSAFVNLKIAPPVSIGVSGTLYSSRAEEKMTVRDGYTFGVLIKPDPRLNIGIVYYKLPEMFSGARMGLENIENETATSGISYMPDDQTVLSIDLRAVNKEDLPTSRQVHAGIERRFFNRLALRAGYYRSKETHDDVMSFGIGILPRWEKISKYSGTTRNDVLSYSFIADERSFERRWHIISLLVRL